MSKNRFKAGYRDPLLARRTGSDYRQRFGRQTENKRTTEAVFKGPITEAFYNTFARLFDEAGALNGLP